MTQPGYAPPPRVGWWVKRSRHILPDDADLALIGATPSTVTGALVQPSAGALVLTGSTPTVNVAPASAIEPSGGALTLTGHEPQVTGTPPLSVVGDDAIRDDTITIPAHQIGDLIVIYAYRNSNTLPTKPTAGGTVPTWTDIDASSGANSTSSRTAYTVATATNHTSGTWSAARGLCVVVLRNQNASPIGGHAEASGGVGATTSTSPSITLSNSSGTSKILTFHGAGNGSGSNGFTDWPAAPAGFTRLADAAVANLDGVCVNSKDDTTTDGTSVQSIGGASSHTSRAATVEILH